MNAVINDLTITEPQLYPISAEMYHRMGESGILTEQEKTELIEGRIIKMVPIGSKHADWVDRFTEYLVQHKPAELRVRTQNPIYLEDSNEPQPDIALLRSGDYRNKLPSAKDTLLIIEIAETSLSYDRQVKVPLYARFGIPETWIVDVRENRLEVYQQPDVDGYRLMLRPRRGEQLSLAALPELIVDLNVLDLT